MNFSCKDENTTVDKHKQELVRLIIQSLGDMGYSYVFLILISISKISQSAQFLEKESGTTLESPNVIEFRKSIYQGNWNQVESLLSTLLIPSQDLQNVLFMIREQKYLELLEIGDLKSALHVLRHELAPLNIHFDKLHELSGWLMSFKDLKSKSKWDGRMGDSRKSLLSNLQCNFNSIK